MRHKYAVRRVNGIQKGQHVTIAETCLGRALPSGSVVHHADGNSLNNRKDNLVICPNKAYHNLLHARMKAKVISGDPEKRPCRWCHQYDDLINLHVLPVLKSFAYWHPECGRIKQRKHYEEKKSAKH